MTIFDVLTMIGGLCLFLFGMNVMGDGLERRAGNSLKALLGKLTDSKIKEIDNLCAAKEKEIMSI